MKIAVIIVTTTLYLIGFYFVMFSNTPKTQVQMLNNSTSIILADLVKTKFFRIIRLNLRQECPLKYFNIMCKSSSCKVCRCDEKQIPSFWMKTDRVMSEGKQIDLWANERSGNGNWVWHVQDQENDQGEYFDIDSNIQSFTNYNGSLIWDMIYEDNCFSGKSKYQQMCTQEKILYKIISGLHASISSHLSKFYKQQNKDSFVMWADRKGESKDEMHFNAQQYSRRVFQHPERVQNMILLYKVLAAAIKQISHYLSKNYTINSENISQDLKASQIMQQVLVDLKKFRLSRSDKQMFKLLKADNPKVKEYQNYFHNISRILNCVECEKCRLFGKMQTYGIGTALKILMGYQAQFKRNQIVALFNVFNKVSMSVQIYFHQKNKSLEKEAKPDYFNQNVQIYLFVGFVMAVFLWMVMKIDIKAKVKKGFHHSFPPEAKKDL